MTRRCRLCDSHVASGHLLCEGCEAALRAKTPAERKEAFMRGWQQVYIDACSRQQGTPKRCPTMDEQEATAVARERHRIWDYSPERMTEAEKVQNERAWQSPARRRTR